jgi:YegS/Rv2252/BmrU family lipid kinase
MDGWTMVVCNPVSGSGKGRACLAVVRRALDDAGVTYAYDVTRGRGHAAQLARSAVCSGCSAVVAIGGDGTFFEVVNGVMNPAEVDGGQEPSRVAVGLVQAGRGSDFGRSIGVPADMEEASERLLDGRTRVIDLGFATFLGFDGKERSRYFANAAGLGFDGEVTLRANAGPRIFGSTIPYLNSLVRTLIKYRNKRISVKLDGAEPWSAVANSIVIANGQYFGGGMKIAPDAHLSDGLLNITLLGDLGKVDLIRNLPRVYDGSHVTHPKVRILSARNVEITSPERVLLQADGEVLGTAPASFRVVPAALRMIV